MTIKEQLEQAAQSYAETYGLYEGFKGSLTKRQMQQINSFINFVIYDWFPDETAVEKTSIELDPKGNVVLQTYERNSCSENKCDALVFVGGDTKTFVAATGYDKKTGEWEHGRFCEFAYEAESAGNPRMLEGLNSPWEVEDIEHALDASGYATTPENVKKVLDAWNGRFSEVFLDSLTETGNEVIAEAVLAVEDELQAVS